VGGSFAQTTGKRPRTWTTTTIWGRKQDVRLFVSKRSIRRVSVATTRASISFPGRTRAPAETRHRYPGDPDSLFCKADVLYFVVRRVKSYQFLVK
jgi:hypothetical protein